MDGSRQRGGTVTGRRGGGIARENYEVTSGGACTSFRFRSRSTLSLLLQPPPRPSHPPSSTLSSRVWSWRLDGLVARFSDPLFHRRFPPRLSLSPPRPRTSSTIRCRTSVQRNFAQWRNLAITIACLYSPVIPYRLYFSLTGVALSPPKSTLSLFLLSHPCSYCIMHIPHQINGGCCGPFGGPDSCTSIIQVGAESGGVQDTPGAQEVSRLGAQVTRCNWRKLSSLKRVPYNARSMSHVVKLRKRKRAENN